MRAAQGMQIAGVVVSLVIGSNGSESKLEGPLLFLISRPFIQANPSFGGVGR